MASIAEDEFLNEKFSLQGTSTGKVSGRRKVVSGSCKLFFYKITIKYFLKHLITKLHENIFKKTSQNIEQNFKKN